MTGINDFAKAISDALDSYSEEAVEAAKSAIDRVAKGADDAPAGIRPPHARRNNQGKAL